MAQDVLAPELDDRQALDAAEETSDLSLQRLTADLENLVEPFLAVWMDHSQTLRVASSLHRDDLFAGCSDAVARDATPGHHAAVFGLIGGRLGWDPESMACAYLYSASAALVGAALRLLPLGQLAGQAILSNVVPMIAVLARDIQGREAADIWSFAPGLEIAGMRHATLEARLFRS